MSGDQRKFGFRQFSVDHMEVSATNGTGLDPDEYFTWTGCGCRYFLFNKRRSLFPEDHCPHGFAPLCKMPRLLMQPFNLVEVHFLNCIFEF
jgi:hypothetical protein